MIVVIRLPHAGVVASDQPDELLRMHLMAMGIPHVLLRHGRAVVLSTPSRPRDSAGV